MSRQLRISEDVHEMLTLLKTYPSMSYDDVIRDLIREARPLLQGKIEKLRALEKEDPRKAAGERLLLQREMEEDYVFTQLDKASEEEERRIDEQIDAELAARRTPEEIEQEKEWEILNERRRQLLREKILREKEAVEKMNS